MFWGMLYTIININKVAITTANGVEIGECLLEISRFQKAAVGLKHPVFTNSVISKLEDKVTEESIQFQESIHVNESNP